MELPDDLSSGSEVVIESDAKARPDLAERLQRELADAFMLTSPLKTV